MPIKIPNDLPATKILTDENIFVMTETRALSQDIRPLEILILNLMPTKIVTETQLSRLLGNTPLQVNLTFMTTSSYASKNTPPEHLKSFYVSFGEVRRRYFDGFIITGAPVEMMNFGEVDYWDELCDIMEWSKKHVHSTMHICWGALAGLYYHFGIEKHPLPCKISGVYSHRAENTGDRPEPLFRGFDDVFMLPHSRYSGVYREDIEAKSDLTLLAASDEAGVCAVLANGGSQIFITGHPEYDADTLDLEYKRDLEAGINPSVPENYYAGGDPANQPLVTWRACANLLFSNWLNYYVYQTTPYDIESIEKSK